MRWLADECVHAPVVSGLRTDGHDVIYAAEVSQQTVDIDLAHEALKCGRILLTEDLDFGELAFRGENSFPGIVLLRIPAHRRLIKWPRLKMAIKEYGEALHRGFTVIKDNSTRYRSLTDDKQE